jgi:hypothetical protein
MAHPDGIADAPNQGDWLDISAAAVEGLREEGVI